MIVRVACPECDCLLGENIEYDPGKEPYPTMNPDDPRYADPGSPSSCEGAPEFCPGCGEKVDPEIVFRRAEEYFADQVQAAAEDAAERAYDDYRDRLWDKYSRR